MNSKDTLSNQTFHLSDMQPQGDIPDEGIPKQKRGIEGQMEEFLRVATRMYQTDKIKMQSPLLKHVTMHVCNYTPHM